MQGRNNSNITKCAARMPKHKQKGLKVENKKGLCTITQGRAVRYTQHSLGFIVIVLLLDIIPLYIILYDDAAV